MTLQKKLKKSIRARSQKTGESYTAARRQVLLARDKKTETPNPIAVTEPIEPPPPPAPAPAAPPVPAKATKPVRGEVSDESARKKTGHGLDHWFAVLDAFGAAGKGHTAAAAHLNKEHGVPGWHAQGITVAYERAHGLRETNQSCTGTFQVSVSKTVPAPVAEVLDALKDANRRSEWLQGADPGLVAALDSAFTGDKPREVKTKGSDNAWLRFPWEGHTVEIRVTGKPKGASVVADNSNLASPELVEQRRAQWRVALAGLQKHLGG
ncbi:MAG TPA: DUF4287 domain-containing protein [Thermoanaerobaculia bacterium]|jgi:hypothetical protein|nr:DUF4287 domain-containing protein [Thermoanaerobaculia bacterium]